MKKFLKRNSKINNEHEETRNNAEFESNNGKQKIIVKKTIFFILIILITAGITSLPLLYKNLDITYDDRNPAYFKSLFRIPFYKIK